MVWNRQWRNGLTIAFLAISCALLLLLALHSATSGPDFLAIMPLLVSGIVSPLSLFTVLAACYSSRVPQAPALAAAFERPPPCR